MSRAVMERQRGQTLPLALAGTVAMLVFAFFALNYANTLRWQIRAQNAADSAAQAILTLQTQEFNSMNATLYAAAIEEYRIRHLLNGMILASHQQGNCGSKQACLGIETTLEQAYDRAVSRYTDDVKTLQQITATLNYNAVNNDSIALLNRIADCTSPFGGDCAFHYAGLQISPRHDTEFVGMDAKRIVRPYPGKPTGNSGVNEALFAPVQVEVWTCAVVPSPIPSFLGWTFAPFRAMARGAATPVMVEEDWLQPGSVVNPITSLPYQTKEKYVGGAFNDWFDIDFGGNPNVAVPSQGFGSLLNGKGFVSIYLGWWNSIPIHPVTRPEQPAQLGCTS